MNVSVGYNDLGHRSIRIDGTYVILLPCDVDSCGLDVTGFDPKDDVLPIQVKGMRFVYFHPVAYRAGKWLMRWIDNTIRFVQRCWAWVRRSKIEHVAPFGISVDGEELAGIRLRKCAKGVVVGNMVRGHSL